MLVMCRGFLGERRILMVSISILDLAIDWGG